MTDTIIHKDRPDLASDAVEVAIFGVNANVFTLVLSAEKKAAWVEIDGGDGKILIAFPIDKVADLIMKYVAAERQKTGTSDVVAVAEKAS
jgi:hypothetical protein